MTHFKGHSSNFSIFEIWHAPWQVFPSLESHSSFDPSIVPNHPVLKTYFHKFSHRAIRFGKFVFIRSLKVRFLNHMPEEM